MKLLVASLLVCAMLAGCLADEGGLTDFANSPNCPEYDVSFTETLRVGQLAGTGRVGGADSQTFNVDVAGPTGWNAREAACVDAIQVDIAWTNSEDSGGDLYVGVTVPGTNVHVQGHDEQQFAVDGRHHESVLAPTAIDGYSGQALLDGLEVIIYSDWAAASSFGLDVQATVTLVV